MDSKFNNSNMQYKFFLDNTNEQFSAQSTLDRIQERIREGKLKTHYCKDLARELINCLCGKQKQFEKHPEQFSITYFIQDVMQERLLDTQCDNNIFLLQIGKDYHTFVIEKIHNGEEVKFIIYHSWYSTFTLDWWLGNDKAPHRASEEQLLLREQYGKGKELTINELQNFIFILSQPKERPFSKKIGIAGAYTAYEYCVEYSKPQFT
ncbi:hypothetical protein [Fluoribacter gormanii]|uniref:hypothetical protein n=1 Tax=Fluoribacter gormanii TaxID=464 RepID=UPI0010417F75|nr:hypothetical protein [Fluoribacter gormanii]